MPVNGSTKKFIGLVGSMIMFLAFMVIVFMEYRTLMLRPDYVINTILITSMGQLVVGIIIGALAVKTAGGTVQSVMNKKKEEKECVELVPGK